APWRWLIAGIAPIFIAAWGLKKKSLCKSGALAGLVVGFILTLANLCFFSTLITFFITASKLTKFRAHRKRKIEAEFAEGGQRNWVQVLCNGGISAQLALLYILETGCSETPINFSKHYTSSWLSIAVLTSLACSCGDTFASEVGSVMGSHNPWLIMSLRRVPIGTNGGVSLAGTVCSLLGGFIVGVAYYFTLILTVSDLTLLDSPPQWPIILMGTIGGGLGSLIDSILGSTFQYSGRSRKLKMVVEKAGGNVDHITGWSILDNHSVNLLSSLFTSIISPYIAIYTYTSLQYL
ncbi:hypothetical protein LOTGIDRAFT_134535, partial [Lottia gigantea]